MEYRQLKGLSVKDYEYPGENNAFALLKKIPILDQVMAAYLKYCSQVAMLPEVQGDCYRVTKETFPKLYEIYQKALQRLDIKTEYPLFVKGSFEYNAYTMGGSSPFVVIHSSMVQNLTEKELLFILGHELGHVKSGHLIYYMMASQINQIIASVPMLGTAILSTGLHYALIHWQRMNEFTADRAGVIAAGDVESGILGLGRLLGTSENIPNVNFTVETLKKQNDTFEELNKDIVGKIICAMNIMNSTHPWTISRIKELEKWQTSGEYESFLQKYEV